MHDFIELLLSMFSRAVGPAVIMMIVGGVIWYQIYSKAKGDDAVTLRKAVPVLLLMGYLGGLAVVTLLIRTTGDGDIQWHLFCSFREAWNAFTLQMWLNPLLNIGMFVPLGVLLPLVAKPFRRWYLTLAVGAGGSFLIEVAQYLFDRGSADVDDLFCNTLGTMLGFCLCMVVLSAVEKRPGLCAAYAVLPVASAAVLAGVFITYYTQPYGNLADAPAFAANTRGVEWVLECELSDEAGSAGIYRMEPFTRESCEEFVRAFAQRVGVEITEDFDVDYYDNTSYYSDYSTFCMLVDLNDCSYEYSNCRVFGYGGTASEAELRAALSDLGIEVPAAAEFVDEGDGLYTFHADRIEDSGTFFNGEVYCYVGDGGALYMVQNDLSVSTFCGDVPVISEQEAYSRLCRGLFSYGGRFESRAPQEVHVMSCTLDYVVDSKGFSQPVYLFELGGLDAVFVPAMAD